MAFPIPHVHSRVFNKKPYNLKQIEALGIEEFSCGFIPSMPKKLYKYFSNTTERSGNEEVNYSIDSLRNNTVFLQTPAKFDDIYDSDVYINPERFELLRMREYCKRSNLDYSEDESTSCLERKFVQRFCSFYREEKNKGKTFFRAGLSETEEFSDELLIRSLFSENNPDLVFSLHKVLQKEYSGFVTSLKETFRIACFTSSPFSLAMWGGSYANESKGFCIEYSVDSRFPEYLKLCAHIFPVIYSVKRDDVTDLLVNCKDKRDSDEVFGARYFNGVLRKSIDWFMQDEWRLVFYHRNKEGDNYCRPFFKISKVYLGERMEESKQIEISSICKEKGIPCVGVEKDNEYFRLREKELHKE